MNDKTNTEISELKARILLLEAKVTSLTEAGDGLYHMVYEDLPSSFKRSEMSDWCDATNQSPAQ